MSDTYFLRVKENSPTRFWINNPTLEETDLAIESGAVGCTTNPTYVARLLSTGTVPSTVLDDALAENRTPDEAAAHIQREMVSPIIGKFAEIHKASGGFSGLVSIQGDPFTEHDTDAIVAEARKGAELGPNFIAKIPVSKAGLEAISQLVVMNTPIIATEVMSIAQAIAVCKVYQQAVQGSSYRPAFFVTHITGIFDEYLSQYVQENSIDISSDALWHAGVAVARKQYRVMKENGYPGVILGGGARDLHHFTEFVGGDVHITINWKGTADRLIDANPPVVYRFESPVPESYLDELIDKLPVFKKAYFAKELPIDDFADFGPVVHFRNKFEAGWRVLLDRINA